MKLYTGIFAKPVKEIILYILHNVFSPFPALQILSSSLDSSPTNANEVYEKLDSLERDVDHYFYRDGLCIESRFFPPDEWATVKEETTLGYEDGEWVDLPLLNFKVGDLNVWAPMGKDGSFITTTNDIKYKQPEIMFEWDRNILNSKSVISFIKSYVQDSRNPLFQSFLYDETNITLPLAMYFHPNILLSFFYSNPEDRYLTASRMEPIAISQSKERLYGLGKKLLDIIQRKSLIQDASLEHTKIKIRDLFSSQREAQEDALVLMLMPGKDEFPLLNLLHQTFGIENNFSWHYRSSDLDMLPHHEKMLVSGLSAVSSIFHRQLEEIVEQAEADAIPFIKFGEKLTAGETDLARLQNYHETRKSWGHDENEIFRETPTLSSRPMNIDKIITLAKEGLLSLIDMHYVFYGNADHSFDLIKTLNDLLPEESKEKDVFHLYKLRNLYVLNGIFMQRLEMVNPSESIADLETLLKSPPYPGVIDIQFKESGKPRIVAYPFPDGVRYAVFLASQKDEEKLKEILPSLSLKAQL